jgi:hypothetical protein
MTNAMLLFASHFFMQSKWTRSLRGNTPQKLHASNGCRQCKQSIIYLLQTTPPLRIFFNPVVYFVAGSERHHIQTVTMSQTHSVRQPDAVDAHDVAALPDWRRALSHDISLAARARNAFDKDDFDTKGDLNR